MIHYRLSLLIAWRYLCHKEKDSQIALMTKMCFLGIAIGTFALMLTLIITNGFEKVISEKMRGINTDIIISAPGGGKLDFMSIAKALKTEMPDRIKAVGAKTIRQALISSEKTQSVMFLTGVDVATEGLVSSLGDKVIKPTIPVHLSGQNSLAMLLKPGYVLVGQKTAQEYDLHVGSQVDLLIPEATGKRKIVLDKHRVTVAGVFKVGLEEFDSNLLFMPLEDLHELFDEKGADFVTVKLTKSEDYFLHETLFLLRKRLSHLEIRSWQDLYPALVASLKLEKYVMFFILALITLVACMNMISLLFMQIQNKRYDIAILQSMGCASLDLQAVFLALGMVITLGASLFGLGLAFIAGSILERYPFIQLPDVYYVSYLPARMDASIFIVVFVATLLLGFLATWIPARRTQKIDILQVLRQG